MQLPILSVSRNIHPPFFEVINPFWTTIDPLNDQENPDGGTKVDVRSGKPSKEIQAPPPPPPSTPKKKSFLRVIK